MISDIDKKILELLKSARLSATKPRKAVLAVLLQSHKPMTHDEILSSISSNAPDKVTIYRVLENFVKKDIVHKAYLDARKWHFELADRCSSEQCHPHFTCSGCGQTECLPEVSSPALTIKRKGFIIQKQQIKLEGLCPSCSIKNESYRKKKQA